jgi:hypothetical protein
MTISRIGSTGSRIGRHAGLIGAALLLVTACAAATGAGASPRAGLNATAVAGSTPTTAAATIGASALVGVPGISTPVATVAGGGSSGMAITYPYPGYPGGPGLAPTTRDRLL